MLCELVAVALLAASPVGELLIAYPTGLALGLDPLVSLAASVIFNIVPIPILLHIMSGVESRLPRFLGWFRERGRIYERYINRIGIPLFLALTPMVGVYGTTVSMKLLGFRTVTCLLVQSMSLALYGILLYMGTNIVITVIA
jgi:uncharacterized membrane protein